MRSLHVAALAYPTAQGTQAALHAMLTALGEAGHDTHLLCYADAAFSRDGPYRVHRVRARRRLASFRSGPSLAKLMLDAALLAQLRPLAAELLPDLIVAHHVEAAACVSVAGLRPFVFMAHTSLRAELPSYFPAALGPVLAEAGAQVDRRLSERADAVLAVSPLLAEVLAQDVVHAEPCALPWWPEAPIGAAERAEARAFYGLSGQHQVALYAGNLDAYQGLTELLAPLAGLARQHPRFVWLIATESPLEDFARRLDEHGLRGRVTFTSLAGEQARRRVHAAADVALAPRAAAGGLPIKLLDALARGLPVLATRRACAGLCLPSSVVQIPDDSPSHWRTALEQMFARPLRDADMLGPAFIARHHAPARFVAQLLTHVKSPR